MSCGIERRAQPYREIFTVSYDYGDDPPFLSDYVERRQVVEVFYLGLLEFYESSDQLKKNWKSNTCGSDFPQSCAWIMNPSSRNCFG